MQTVIRESEEGIGVMVESRDINFVHLSHRLDKSGCGTYYGIYFSIEKCPAEPVIGEPSKCSDLNVYSNLKLVH